MKRILNTTLSIIGFIAVTILLLSGSTSADIVETEKTIADETMDGATHLPQQVHAVTMPATPTFAGELIPMNVDTRERLDRELSVNSYWHSSTLLNIKMANKYFPTIERILAEQGVPDDFKYLAVAESNLRNVSSSAAARGIWQFRKLAAQEWDLEVNSEVDERYHIEKATVAACRYLKKLHDRFGSWANAAAAYNVGPTNFAKMLREQGQTSFYDLNLNDETSRYVFRLAAIKEIMRDPNKFGFYVDAADKYPGFENTYLVDVNASVPSWADFAEQHGVTYRMLKYYNPWLRDSKLTVKSNRYQIRLPRS